MKKHFLLIAVLLILSAAFNQPVFAQDTIKTQDTAKINKPESTGLTDERQFATIYIYRPRNFTGSAISYNIYLNDSLVCHIKNNTKYAIRVYKEGSVELSAKTEQKRKVNLNLKFGGEYYLKCGVTMGVLVGRPDLNLIFPEQGRLDFENLDAKNTQPKNKE